MPKKLNFLGGQQNYDPNTGEYEPDLTNKQGEPIKNFKSFGKDKDESFDTVNNKRMGKEQPKSEEPKGSTQYFKHPEIDGVWHDTGKTIEKGGNSYKVYENEQGKTWAVSDRFSKQFQPFDKDKKTELLSKEYLDKFYELSGGDENKMLDLIRKDPAYQNNDNGDPNDTWSMGDLEGIVGAYFEKRNSQKENNSFEETNKKRMGKAKKPEFDTTTQTGKKDHNKWTAENTEPGKMVKYYQFRKDYDGHQENNGFHLGEETERAKMLNNGLAMKTQKQKGGSFYKDENGKYKQSEYYIMVDIETGAICGRVNNYEDGLEKSNDPEYLDRIKKAKDNFKQRYTHIFGGN